MSYNVWRGYAVPHRFLANDSFHICLGAGLNELYIIYKCVSVVVCVVSCSCPFI